MVTHYGPKAPSLRRRGTAPGERREPAKIAKISKIAKSSRRPIHAECTTELAWISWASGLRRIRALSQALTAKHESPGRSWSPAIFLGGERLTTRPPNLCSPLAILEILAILAGFWEPLRDPVGTLVGTQRRFFERAPLLPPLALLLPLLPPALLLPPGPPLVAAVLPLRPGL